jgi:hypothetical protein
VPAGNRSLSKISFNLKLEPYEEFRLDPEYPVLEDLGGWVGRFTTHVLIHRKHTKKDVFMPHSVYSAVWFSVKPSEKLVGEAYLPKFRESSLKHLATGKYPTEELIGDKFQTVQREYNQWLFWDNKARKTVGKLHKL